MRIVFVRHGHPDYEHDCLTELGHLHAAAASERLTDEGIGTIYASTCGRAYETAQYTAKKLGLEIIPCDFIREMTWASKDGVELFKDGNPWFISWRMAENGQSLLHTDWHEREPFCHSEVTEHYRAVTSGVDEWLMELGYAREGEYYRVIAPDTDRTVAMFSHGGSSTAALSHMLNLPFPYFCATIYMDFTAISVIQLGNDVGSLTAPRIEILNDTRHIRFNQKP